MLIRRQDDRLHGCGIEFNDDDDADCACAFHFNSWVYFLLFYFFTGLALWKKLKLRKRRYAVLGWLTQLPRQVTSVCFAPQPQLEPQPQSKLGTRLMMCNFWAKPTVRVYECVCVCVYVARVCGNCKPSMTRYSRSLCPTVVNRFPHYTIRFLAVLAQLATPLSPPPLLFISILLIFLVSFPTFCRRKRFTLNTAMVRRDRQRYEWFSFFCSSLAFLMSYRCMFCIMRWMIPAHK